jgi:uncharacterized protein
MEDKIKHIAEDYKVILQNLYGNELAELVLFGSYARGDQHEYSDLDFAIVLQNPQILSSAELKKIVPFSSKLSLKYGITISSLPISFEKKKNSMQGIYQEIRKEGIIV